MKRSPLVSILMGSESDLETMNETARVLKEFGVSYEIAITSAHRSPNWTRRYLEQAEARGIQIIIAGAGGAAHLAGVAAAHAKIPVVGVPIDSSPLKGLDSLLSTVQMPAGVPVATMAIGRAGAKNAGLFAVQILAIHNKRLSNKIKQFKNKLEIEIEEKTRRIKRQNSRV